MTCNYCGGRGWAWRGVASGAESGAEREPCEPCKGSGRTQTDWGALSGFMILLFSAVLTLVCLFWSVQLAFGESAGEMTLAQFRQHSQPIQHALIAGAMAVTEHAGLRCPEPQMSVAEYASALRWRTRDDQQPWIKYYFELIDQKGCKVDEGGEGPAGVDSKEGA